MSGEVERIGDYRLYDDGSTYTTHLYTIETKMKTSHAIEFWQQTEPNLYTDYAKAHAELLRFAHLKEIPIGQLCPSNIPTYEDSKNNFKAGCVGCALCQRYRGKMQHENYIYCYNPITL